VVPSDPGEIDALMSSEAYQSSLDG
jgi:hypothetical protein